MSDESCTPTANRSEPYDYPCTMWALRGLPDGADELVLHYETSEQSKDEPHVLEVCVRMYDRTVRLQGWEPLEDTTHVHVGVLVDDAFQRRHVISVHGLGVRTPVGHESPGPKLKHSDPPSP